MILKICPYCQTENPENAVFCKKCGALFRGQPQIRDTIEEKNNRKNKLIIVACVIMLIAALAVFLSGSKNDAAVYPTTTAGATDVPQPAETTISPAPSANATTAQTTQTTTQTTTHTTTQTTTSTTAPAVLSINEICREYNNAVGAIKNSKENISIHKTEKINLEITHFSLPVPTETINSFMMKLIPETDITYNFTNGVAKEDSKLTLSGFIPPAVKSVPEVSADDLLSAEKDANGTINLKFKADSSSFADGQTVFPQYVDSSTDVLDFATFSLGPVKIVKAEIEYPATEIKAELDTDGNLKKLTIIQPVNTTSTGGVGSLTADVGMKLKAETSYEIV